MHNGICITLVRNGGIKRITEKCVTTEDKLTTIKTKVLNVVVLLFLHVIVSISLVIGFLQVCTVCEQVELLR